MFYLFIYFGKVSFIVFYLFIYFGKVSFIVFYLFIYFGKVSFIVFYLFIYFGKASLSCFIYYGSCTTNEKSPRVLRLWVSIIFTASHGLLSTSPA